MSPILLPAPEHDFCTTDLVSWTLGNHAYDQDRKIYIDADRPERSLSASETRAMVRQLTAGFLAHGVKPGDCVCIYAFNDILYPVLLLGIIGAGGQFTGCNPAYTAAELTHHLRITNARFLISEVELLQKVKTAVVESGIPNSNVFVCDGEGTTMVGHKSVQDLFQYGTVDWVRFESHEQAKTTTAAMLSTSGTTGLPKAAMISHHSFIMMNHLINDSQEKPYEVSRLISMPMFHMYGFPFVHIAPLREGIPTFIMRRFDLSRYLAIIEQQKITETLMVPAIIKSILKRSSLENIDLQSLQLVWSAGTILDQHTQQQIQGLLVPSARVVQTWGMTEAGFITTFLWPEKDDSGSVGRLLPKVEAKIVDSNGNILHGDYIQGEILVKGPLIMQGYLSNKVASNDAIDADGWLKTGDIGYTVQGKFYIVDRKKEMIKVRGWQVSPAELESVLMRHPAVLDCAVIGIPIANGTDEVPRAYIVQKSDVQLTADEVKTFVSIYLAKYKSLDGGVVFTDYIPKNSTGKTLRNVLRDRAKREDKQASRPLLSRNACSRYWL